ncbi:hypothetical protein [Viridibacillus arvi]
MSFFATMNYFTMRIINISQLRLIELTGGLVEDGRAVQTAPFPYPTKGAA